MGNSAITPATIGDEKYSIPIYQRLFTWTPTEIRNLLEDLYSQYNKPYKEHYYIGLLTATSKNELVDGQQRFVVLTLMAIVMKEKHKEWEHFLNIKDQEITRISFKAREDDRDDIKSLNEHITDIQDKESKKYNISDIKNLKCKNEYMKEGIKTICEFINDKEDAEDFCKYIYEHVAFFIQKLPEGYSGKMLNKYFESMNSTGRNLENHEILKVELIEKVLQENQDADEKQNNDKYNRLVNMWNQASRMNQTIFPLSDEEKRKNYQNIINQIKNGDFDKNNENNENKQYENEFKRTILDVLKNGTTSYDKNDRHSNMHSFLKFTDFLLLVLYIILEDNGVIVNKSEFFKPENLRNTFNKYKDHYKPDDYIKKMFKFRIILDWAVIRVDDNYDYNLALTNNENSKLEQFEAMLYASTSRDTYCEWIPTILRHVINNGNYEKIEENLLQILKRKDNDNHPFILKENNSKRAYELSDFRFNNFNRYFYRRLDYYIWEYIVYPNNDNENDNILGLKPKDLEDLKKAVKAYKFHSYNSEEHLYPRDDEKQINKWVTEDGKYDEKSINAFGNLALISSPFNSSQGYDSLDRKFGSIRDQIKQKKLQSIKLALMYFCSQGMAENWAQEQSHQHGKLMFEFLKNTYPEPESPSFEQQQLI